MDIFQWADRLSWLLFPSEFSTLQRHRWLNSVEPISEMLLLSVHNILPRAGIL